jgi:glycosyltransferase involved in cell wall biosynthesis
MKIGVFDPYLDDLGGGERYMITLASCLSKANDVFVFWNEPNDLKKISDRFDLDISRIKVKRNIFSSKYPSMRRMLESFSYDIIIVLSDGSLPVLFSKKLFIHFQQPFIKKNNPFKNYLKKIRVSGFFCNSTYTKSFTDKVFAIDSRIIYPPVDSMLKNKEKENYILHVGRFRAKNIGSSDYKKQSIMVDAFKKMVDNGLSNWSLVMAIGLQDEDSIRFKELEKKTKGYPIKFFLNLSKDKLSELYSKSKIYWHASGFGEDIVKNPELAEHFGISTVEAMSAGCVPVVINAGGQKEIVESGKDGFLWNTIEDLMDSTRNLIEDNNTWAKMSKKAIKKSSLFTGDRFCTEIRKFIK